MKANGRKEIPFTLKSKMLCKSGCYYFSFSCELCDGGYTTGSIMADSIGEALQIARREARPHFNCCHRCHRWICDAHYNIDEMMCTECASITPTNNE